MKKILILLLISAAIALGQIRLGDPGKQVYDILDPINGGTGQDFSAATGIPRIAAGTFSADAGVSHLVASSSADLAGVINDETGTGLLVFGTAPTFVTSITTPVIISGAGDPADAGVLRLGNAEVISWEASPAGADITLTVDASEIMQASGTFNAATLTEGGFAVPNSQNNLSFFSGTATSAEFLTDISDETGSGLVMGNDTPIILTPDIRGKVTRNATAVNDNDCTGEQGLWWYDTTDSAFEFCNANSGTPSVLGGGTAAGSDGEVQYNDGGSSFGGATGLYYNDTNLSTFIGDSAGSIDFTDSSAEGLLIYRSGEVAIIEMATDWDIASANAQIRAESHSGSNVNAGFVFRGISTRGTRASPTATAANDTLVRISMGGYTNAVVNDKAAIYGIASSLWSASNSETELKFDTTPNGSVTPSTKLIIAGDGGIRIEDSGSKPTCTAALDGTIFNDTSTKEICHDDGTPAWEDLIAGAGGGTIDDDIEVEDGDNGGTFSPVDTTARFEDSADINFALVDGGAGGPDEITGTIRADSVALTTDTTGNYVLSITNGIGITGGDGGSEGAALTLAFDFTDVGADWAGGSDECRFTNEGAGAGGWVCEGATANLIETKFIVTDPTTTDKTITFPDATGEVTLLGQEIALTTETSGNYVADVTCGQGLTGCVAASEGATEALALSTDGVRLIELNDDANTPLAGDFIIVEAGANSVDYLTPNAGTNITADLEEDAHCSEHDGTGTTCSGEVLNFDPAEVGAVTWLDNADRAWTFDIAAAGTNPVISFSSNTINVSTGVLQVGGVAVLTAEVNDLDAAVSGTLTVPNGGTGATTLTDGGILLGSGTGAITALGVAGNGQIPIGDGTTDPVLANITAEAGNEITVTNGAGSIQLDVNEANLDLASIGGTLGTGQADSTFVIESDIGTGLLVTAGTVDFAPEEVGTDTWLPNADSTWTFDIAAAGINPTIAFAASSIEIDAHLTIDNQQELRLKEGDGGGESYLAFRAPATLTANGTCTLIDATTDFIPATCVEAIDLTADVTGTLPVGNGGTGATSLTDGGILIGSGTGAITALGVATNGQIPIGDGTTDPVLANITAEAGGEVTVTNGVGSIELDIGADTLDTIEIDETADYTFTTLSGKQDRNNSAVNDDDCTGEQGLWWYDTTDSAFEFCNANSGTPTILGGGAGAPVGASYVVISLDGTLTDERTLAGGTNGIDIVDGGAGLDVTLNFDPTEVAAVTWLDNADRAWTFDIAAAGTNPVISFSSGLIDITTGAFAVTGDITADSDVLLSGTNQLIFDDTTNNTKIQLFTGYGIGVQGNDFRLHVDSTASDFNFLDAAAGNRIVTIYGDGGIQIHDRGTRPTCAAGTLFTIWGEDTATDTFEVCMDTGGGLAWTNLIASGGATAWSAIAVPTTDLTLAMDLDTTTFNWTTTGDALIDAWTLTHTNTSGTDTTVQTLLRLQSLNNVAVGTLNRFIEIDHADGGTADVGLLISETGAGTITAGIDMTGTITTGLDLSDTGIGVGIALGANNITTTSTDIGDADLLIIDDSTITLTSEVSGILPGANGGTNNGFFDVTGPATSLKTFTFPNASATVLTDNAAVTVAQGGTGATSLTGILEGNGAGAFTANDSSIVGQVLRVTGASTFAFGAVDLADTDAVTGILAGANGGTNNAFFDVTGPASTLKTFTFPNASATVLTTNAAVTVTQGGTGATSLTGILEGNGTGAFTANDSSTVGQVLRVTGASTFGWGQLDLADTDAVTGILPIGNVGTVTRDDVEVELITDQFCFVIKEPTNGLDIADHDISSIYSNRAKAITVTEVWCETDVGTATINLQRDDGTAANMLSSDLVCDTNEQDSCASGCDVNTIAAAEDNLAVDNEVDFVLVSVATAPKRVSLCVEYTID